MQMIINELSAKFPLKSVDEGKLVMKQFVDTYFSVKEITKNRSILLNQDYNYLELALGYRLEKWRNDPTVDIEIKRRFRSLLNVSSIYNLEEMEEEVEWILNAEFRSGNYESKGCLLAYAMDGVTISFLSEEYWRKNEIEGIYSEIDDNGEIHSKEVKVPNVSCEENIIFFRNFFQEKIKTMGKHDIKSGKDILINREIYFPSLVFCDNAIRQLENQIGSAEITQVFKKLFELQKAAEKMGNTFCKDYLNKATPESQITLERYKEEHTIKLPDGRNVTFSWHIRFTGSWAGRIFFEPELEKSRIYIGHIGKKLPTVKYH